jgi:hypothetical protein
MFERPAKTFQHLRKPRHLHGACLQHFSTARRDEDWGSTQEINTPYYRLLARVVSLFGIGGEIDNGPRRWSGPSHVALDFAIFWFNLSAQSHAIAKSRRQK